MTEWAQIYVVDLERCVKVGRSKNGLLRVHDHLDAFNLDWSHYWISPFIKHATAAETHLIREAHTLYEPWIRREYLDGDYFILQRMAQEITERRTFTW